MASRRDTGDSLPQAIPRQQVGTVNLTKQSKNLVQSEIKLLVASNRGATEPTYLPSHLSADNGMVERSYANFRLYDIVKQLKGEVWTHLHGDCPRCAHRHNFWEIHPNVDQHPPIHCRNAACNETLFRFGDSQLRSHYLPSLTLHQYPDSQNAPLPSSNWFCEFTLNSGSNEENPVQSAGRQTNDLETEAEMPTTAPPAEMLDAPAPTENDNMNETSQELSSVKHSASTNQNFHRKRRKFRSWIAKLHPKNWPKFRIKIERTNQRTSVEDISSDLVSERHSQSRSRSQSKSQPRLQSSSQQQQQQTTSQRSPQPEVLDNQGAFAQRVLSRLPNEADSIQSSSGVNRWQNTQQEESSQSPIKFCDCILSNEPCPHWPNVSPNRAGIFPYARRLSPTSLNSQDWASNSTERTDAGDTRQPIISPATSLFFHHLFGGCVPNPDRHDGVDSVLSQGSSRSTRAPRHQRRGSGSQSPRSATRHQVVIHQAQQSTQSSLDHMSISLDSPDRQDTGDTIPSLSTAGPSASTFSISEIPENEVATPAARLTPENTFQEPQSILDGDRTPTQEHYDLARPDSHSQEPPHHLDRDQSLSGQQTADEERSPGADHQSNEE